MASLLQRVAGPKNLRKAWKSIKHRANSKGFDLETIDSFRRNLDFNLKQIRKDLLNNQYSFSKLRAHAISKGEGKFRPLRIPAVRDRVVQKAVQLIIEPCLNRKYHIDNPVSFAYIKEKSVQDAIKRVRDLYVTEHHWVYIADIQNFFGSIDPIRLIDEFILKVLPDASISGLIKNAVNTEIGNRQQMEKLGHGCLFQNEDSGLAQGGILSPLFANVYLHQLDSAMLSCGFQMVRYADDFVVMCRSESEAMKAYKFAKEILQDNLNLKLHDLNSKKSKVINFSHLEFLGIHFEGDKVFPGSKCYKKTIKILKDFSSAPPKPTLIENLNLLKAKTQSWASTFFYTSIEPQKYEALDVHLSNAVSTLIKRHGFRLNKKQLSKRDLSNIGIHSFVECTKTMMRKKKSDRESFYKVT